MKTTKPFKKAIPGRLLVDLVAVTSILASAGVIPSVGSASVAQAAPLSAEPVIYWSREAQRAIVPAGPGGIFGPDNYGNKFPGEAALYMGIVHVAIYDTALAFEGGYRPYAIALTAPQGASAEAAIATATYNTLIGLQPELGLEPPQQAKLDGHYNTYLANIPDGQAKTDGIAVGARVAAAVVVMRTNDGRASNPQIGQSPFVPPPPGPGVWDPGGSPPVGLRLPLVRPLALRSASQFRPDGPSTLTSEEYTEDFDQVRELGYMSSTVRTPDQTSQALFWTDHDIRQWNDSMLALANAHGLGLLQTARMLAMAHLSGGDAMIGCFDAKYHYWFWRPYQAIARADTDGNPATQPDLNWLPLRATPNFPEYPSAHACHSTAMAEALHAFFGTDNVTLSLYSRVTRTTRTYDRFHDVVKDVNEARVLIGFHFRNSDQQGSSLGRRVAGYVVSHFFRPLRVRSNME